VSRTAVQLGKTPRYLSFLAFFDWLWTDHDKWHFAPFKMAEHPYTNDWALAVRQELFARCGRQGYWPSIERTKDLPHHRT
jgi:hypothetical protein